jgi:hypothetical protein
MYYIISRASGDIIDKLPLYAGPSDLNRYSAQDFIVIIY